MALPELLDETVRAVQSSPRYACIDAGLVRRIAAQELAKGRSLKDAIKAVRSKLHQVGGAYQETAIPYAHWRAELAAMDPGLSSDSPALQAFCKRALAQHASTRERLPVLERFFHETLASLGPIHSVLDLACGLNPLALPWMPLAQGAQYYACDIYTDMVEFINDFLRCAGQAGLAETCDLVAGCPQRPAQLALLLKTIPCLEQIDKEIGARLLESIPAEAVLVSFPARSLGGRSKGMLQNYEARFRQIVDGKDWEIERFEFSGELAYLIKK